ncbi:hypothetical protein L195_g005790, partial [Trifolium pratense]
GAFPSRERKVVVDWWCGLFRWHGEAWWTDSGGRKLHDVTE